MPMKSWDFTTLGSTMLSLTTDPGVPFLSSVGLRLDVAGAESNCAIALARLGKRVSWHSKVASGTLGERVISGIRAHGVDVASVIRSDEGRTEQMWVVAGGGDNPTTISYDREGASVESLRIDEIDLRSLHDSQYFHATGITPALSEDSRNAVLDAVQLACKAGTKVSFDVNYRSKLREPSRAQEVLSTIIPGIHILFIKETDLEMLWSRRGNAETEMRRLQEEFGIPNIVLTQSREGASALLGDHFESHPAFRGEAVSPIGAGDALAAGVLYSLMEDEEALALKRGCAMASLARQSRSDYVVGGRQALDSRIQGEKGWEVLR